MENKTLKYCQTLRAMCDNIKDELKYEIFLFVCKKFVDFKLGKTPNKNVSKPEIISHLINKGYMKYSINIETGVRDKLPDDRGVRKAIRELLTEGYPIITTSNDKGCFIVEDPIELDKPQEENHNRAVSILAVDKGYNMVRQLLSGQQNFLR